MTLLLYNQLDIFLKITMATQIYPRRNRFVPGLGATITHPFSVLICLITVDTATSLRSVDVLLL